MCGFKSRLRHQIIHPPFPPFAKIAKLIQSAQSVRRVVLGFFLGFSILVAFDVLVFRLGFYDPYLLPFSSAGMFHMILQGEKTRPFDNPNQVLALGDSRMALRAVIANKMKSGLTYGFAGVAGTLPR